MSLPSADRMADRLVEAVRALPPKDGRRMIAVAGPPSSGKSTIAERLAAYNAKATGSSMRVPIAMVLIEPLDLDKGEVTDKGSVNQRAVLRERAGLVDHLYEEGGDVIRA